MKYDIDFDDPVVLAGLIKTMIEKTPVAYIVLDKNLRVHYINDNFLKLRKLRTSEVMGVQCFYLSNNGVPCEFCAVRETIATGQRRAVLRKDVLPDGTVRYIDDQAIPIYRDDEGNFDYILEIMINRSPVMKLRDEANTVFLNIIKTLTSVLDKKDPYTSTHSNDVGSISSKLARYIGLNEDEVYRIALGALLHDIGKVHVPDRIINKPGRLDAEEYEIVKRHPLGSFKLLENLEGFDEIKDICLRHHERWDGRGYPDGRKERENPLGGYIVGLADTYDAMTSSRSYREGLPHETALEEIRKNLGGQFAPEVGRKFLEMVERHFHGRAALTVREDRALTGPPRPDDRGQITRTIQAADEKKAVPVEELLDNFKFDERLIEMVFEHTPAYYTIISETFEVLYASGSLAGDLGVASAKELVGGKCFEVNNKNMSCFKVENGLLACPVVRAFQTGREQTGAVAERFGGGIRHFDIFAVPLEIVDKHGRAVNCVMEILFDRTDEVNLQQKLEKDIRSLILTLEELIARVNPDDTGNAGAIIEECDSFGEFLRRFSQQACEKYESD